MVANILLVDDHQLFRAGLRRILENSKKFKVIAELNSGEEALQWCRSNTVDIIIMDITMPGIGGVEATRRILCYKPESKIVILTAHTDLIMLKQMIRLGAYGYFTKNSSTDELLLGIQTIYRGHPYIMQDLAVKMHDMPPPTYSNNPLDLLSKRELQIMLMVISGNKANYIAQQLHLSPKTVNSYRYRIFNKLKIKNDVELIHLALSYQIISDEILIKREHS